MPDEFIHLYLPDGKDVDNITVSSSSVTTYNLTNIIFPVQQHIRTSLNSLDTGFTQPDLAIYNSNNAWPAEKVKIVNKGYFDGKNQIITIAISPFQYYPLTNKLNFYSTISFTLHLKQRTNSKMISANHTPKTQSLYSDILKSIVDNPQDIPTSTSTQTLNKSLTSGLPLPANDYGYEYVIITDASLTSYFANFMDWKKRKGINIGIVTTNDIYNNYTSDNISTPPITDTCWEC